MIKKFIAWLLPYMPKKLVWIFSRRYIAGEKIEDAIKVAKELNNNGIKVTIDLLGEYIPVWRKRKKTERRISTLLSALRPRGLTATFL
jgi:proline dehydrogenase